MSKYTKKKKIIMCTIILLITIALLVGIYWYIKEFSPRPVFDDLVNVHFSVMRHNRDLSFGDITNIYLDDYEKEQLIELFSSCRMVRTGEKSVRREGVKSTEWLLEFFRLKAMDLIWHFTKRFIWVATGDLPVLLIKFMCPQQKLKKL